MAHDQPFDPPVDQPVDLVRAVAAEALGTALLLWAIVGSGIAVANDGPLLPQLLPHAVVVGLALAAIIRVLAPVSGAHLNPAVTLAAVLLGHLPRSRAAAYVAAQLAGAAIGTVVANLAAGLDPVTVSVRARDGATLAASELAATAGLVALIFLMVRASRGVGAVAIGVGGYIAAAIVLTPSTAFTNPAVTFARTLSDTFAGIAPNSAPAFVAAQLAGAALAVLLVRRLTGERMRAPDRIGPSA